MKILTILLLILKLNTLEWDIRVIDNFFLKLKRGIRFFLAIFYYSEKCLDCKNTILHKLNRLKDEEYIKFHNIYLGFYDNKKEESEQINWIKKFFKNSNNLFFIIGNKKYEMENFNDIIYDHDLYDKTLDFIKDKIDFLITEIEYLPDFIDLFNKKKLLKIYFGDYNSKYEKLIDYISFNMIDDFQYNDNYDEYRFYFTFNDKLKQEIYKYMNYNPKNNEDKIVVFRENSLVNKFDNSNVKEFKDFNSNYILRIVLDFANFNKMRSCSDPKEIINFLFIYPVLIHFSNNEKKIYTKYEFEKAVSILPKSIIYSMCNPNSESWPELSILLKFDEIQFCKENIIFIYLDTRGLRYIIMREEINYRNIVNFVSSSKKMVYSQLNFIEKSDLLNHKNNGYDLIPFFNKIN